LTLALSYSERQLAEFYLPAMALVERLSGVYAYQQDLIKAKWADIDERNRIERQIYLSFYKPLNARLVRLIAEKGFLIEGKNLPKELLYFIYQNESEAVAGKLYLERDETPPAPPYQFPLESINSCCLHVIDRRLLQCNTE
jgi:hypothetical protein